MTELERMGAAAREASRTLALADTAQKNAALEAIAAALEAGCETWLAANAEDVERAEAEGMTGAMLDRLRLTPERVAGVAAGVREAAALPDPVGAEISRTTRPNGLEIRRVRVPLGVCAIIYEARPNVTVDAAALCLKAGNACILRGGREAIASNRAAVAIMRKALASAGLPEDAVSLVTDTSRESANELMHLDAYVDVLIPRGGAGLIRAVAKQASVPVIRTGEGVCHVYVHEGANLDMAAEIVYNAKCSRPSVCNAAECVLVDKGVAEAFLNRAVPLLDKKNVELRGDAKICNILGTRAKEAEEADWDAEYGDYILALKTVSGVDEAIGFINRHGTGHSEAIVTENPAAAERFLAAVDAAAVYVNASTRFTDGGEFGLGAEIGISTQKLHARGPMGLEELTSWKYLVYGKGQVR
ncbi:MAG: glutamate-5-semialdehyde dehydrogenase [Oscillospiraceae bacterium]|nr:glutamate-5-semialdehyde dehydrogenase [Oscillospiraceae bacterium]